MSNVNGTCHRRLTPHEQTVRALGDRLVEAQRPIRILDAVRWDDGVERAFFARGGRELPPVSPDYYRRRPLAFDPPMKLQELTAIESDVARLLGRDDPAGRIMTRMCGEYREAVHLITQRGTPAFAAISSRLFGRADDRLAAEAIGCPPAAEQTPADEVALESADAAEVLARRFREYFRDEVRVRLSDGLVADAAAGCDYLKLRRGARFTPRELRLLEVHEGWVHLGTTLNGKAQPVCTFLSRCTPGSTLTQEGLAVLTEQAAAVAHPGRLRRLAMRVAGVALAESGANFLEVYRAFLERGVSPGESYQLAVRVFRGSLPEGCGPFTKDLCYSKGFLLVADRLRRLAADGLAGLASLLFCGKTTLDDLPLLASLREEGLLEAPRHVPPPFADGSALRMLAGGSVAVGQGARSRPLL